jgi:hypothetical protein
MGALNLNPQNLGGGGRLKNNNNINDIIYTIHSILILTPPCKMTKIEIQ